MYRAQWESRDLVAAFLAGRDAATDPLWAASGAESVSEYARWAEHLCGCACLQMVLATLGRPVPPIHSIRRGVQAEGGYVETPEGDIRGLIYAGAVAWLEGQGIAARIVLDLPADRIERLFIASVHPGIRRAETPPPQRGGHLVLIVGRTPQGALRFHNPSGDTPETQEDVELPVETFETFFAGRGIAIRSA